MKEFEKIKIHFKKSVLSEKDNSKESHTFLTFLDGRQVAFTKTKSDKLTTEAAINLAKFILSIKEDEIIERIVCNSLDIKLSLSDDEKYQLQIVKTENNHNVSFAFVLI